MSDQMTPAELRAAADQLTRYVGRIPGSPNDPDYLNAWNLAEAAVRLAEVIERAESERARLHRLSASSMYAQGEFDAFTEVERIARGETNEREKHND